MLNDIEVGVSSNWVNSFNFIVFDVVLISLVYYLTADVMGRLNDSALRDGKPRSLFITCPPMVGGGLCTTHRLRAFLLLFTRFIGLGLILIANLAIRGRDKDEIYTAEETVLTHGSVSNFTEDQFLDAVVLRSGCQGNRAPDPSKNEGNWSVVFYGELRGENSDECVTNPALISAAPIEFSSGLTWMNISTGKPGEKCDARWRTMRNRTVAEFFCSRATLSCVFDEETNKTDLQSCRGSCTTETRRTSARRVQPGPRCISSRRGRAGCAE